jgi:hypothetical protein
MATPSKTGDKPVKSKPAATAKTAAKAAPKAAAAKPAAAKSTAKAAKPVAKAPTAKVAAAKTPATKKPALAKAPIKALSPDQRRFYIEVAAYYIAERRGFHGGSEFNDWVNAEAEIDRLLREGVLNP